MKGNTKKNKTPFLRRVPWCLILCLVSVFSWADDIDIFFGSGNQVDNGDIKSNVLLVLDASSSMDNDVDGPKVTIPSFDEFAKEEDARGDTRMHHLKKAVYDLLQDPDLPDRVNLGLMKYSDDGIKLIYGVKNWQSYKPWLASSRANGTITGAFSQLEIEGGTPLIEAYYRAADYFSRITRSECGGNHIVLMTDGEGNGDYDMIPGHIARGCRNREACGRNIATWLKNLDRPVTTHTVNLEGDGVGLLKAIQVSGGGNFYNARNANALNQAFRDVIGQPAPTIRDTTFSSPVLSFNRSNAMFTGENVYFPVFRPSENRRWPGNVKRYTLGSATVNRKLEHNLTLGKNNVPAIDPATGFFKARSIDLFDPLASIPSKYTVERGGVANRLDKPANRKLFTYLTHAGVSTPDKELDVSQNHLISSNALIGKTDIGLSASATDEQRTQLLNWARGVKNPVTGAVRNEIGMPLHSKPVLVPYDIASGESVMFFGTNDGFVHAVDPTKANGPVELWAFMPEELLGNLHLLEQNGEGELIYGADGPITWWTYDGLHNGVTDNKITADTAGREDSAFIYFGLRRGGSVYYALDVKDKNKPKVAWRIRSGDAGFEELGQSWSRPIKAVITVKSGSGNSEKQEEKDVLLFTAGYDEDQDNALPPAPLAMQTGGPASAASNSPVPNARFEDEIGRAIFMVDARTGTLLWRADISTHIDMKYSFPASLAVIDANQDGIHDQFYIGDVGGQVWRFDINNDFNVGASENFTYSTNVQDLVVGGVIAKLAGDDDAATARRFYHSPDVALSSDGDGRYVAVAIGSGWRANPNERDVIDRFYMLKIRSPFENYDYTKPPLTETNLEDVTDTIGSDATSALADTTNVKGWYFTLGSITSGQNSGEKVMSSPLIIDGKVSFTTYEPTAQVVACQLTPGVNRRYSVLLANGSPFRDLNKGGNSVLQASDRSVRLNRFGLTDEPVVVVIESGGGEEKIGTEKGSGVSVDSGISQSYWYKE